MEKGGIAGLTEKKGGKAGSEKPIGDPHYKHHTLSYLLWIAFRVITVIKNTVMYIFNWDLKKA